MYFLLFSVQCITDQTEFYNLPYPLETKVYILSLGSPNIVDILELYLILDP